MCTVLILADVSLVWLHRRTVLHLVCLRQWVLVEVPDCHLYRENRVCLVPLDLLGQGMSTLSRLHTVQLRATRL